MKPLEAFHTDDLKLVYSTLQRQLLEVEDLVDSAFLAELQDHLRSHARAAGIDTDDHQAWVEWLDDRRATPKGRLRLVSDK